MKQDNLYKALKEVSVILEYTDPMLRAKVREEFIWFMDNYKDESHQFYVDLGKPLHEQKMMYESIVILSIILKSSWCDKKTLRRLEREYKVKEDEFFQYRAKEEKKITGTMMALRKEDGEKGFFQRIFAGIKKFFGFGKPRLYMSD